MQFELVCLCVYLIIRSGVFRIMFLLVFHMRFLSATYFFNLLNFIFPRTFNKTNNDIMSHRFHPYKNNLLFLLSFNIIGIHLNIFRILQLTMRLAWRARDNNYTQQKYKV